MITKEYKTLSFHILLSLFSTQAIFAHNYDILIHPEEPNNLKKILPAPVYNLLHWPDQSALNKAQIIDSNSPEVSTAKKFSMYWIKKTLDSSWLPAKDSERLFIKDEYDHRDVVRMKWMKNGYIIEVSQTASIFTVKLSPMKDSTKETDPNSMIRKASLLCKKLFNHEGYRWGWDSQTMRNGVKVPIDNLSNKIAYFTFTSGVLWYLKNDGAVHSMPKPMGGNVKERMPKNDEEAKLINDIDNPEWFRSSYSWHYWFRNVNSWHNGIDIGFYFLKIEGGAWLPNYAGNIDNNWFKEPRPTINIEDPEGSYGNK